MTGKDSHPAGMDGLLEIMTRLRDPETGCPWDLEQDFHSIAPYTLEESYEVVDAIEREHAADLRDELGDLLFQVVFHAQMAKEAGWFEFSDVANTICDKLLRRHPHVFGDEQVADARAQTEAWEQHKEREREPHGSAIDGVPLALPALTRAWKIQKKAARAGFDWPDIQGVFDKVQEELQELRQETDRESGHAAILDECGDLLFAAVNLVRYAGVDPERALRSANGKFTRRFHQVEEQCRLSGKDIKATGIDKLEAYWEYAKQREPGL